jgi:hypothetical protein
LIEAKERKYSELENLIVEKNSVSADEEISLNNIDDSALPLDLPVEEAVSSSEKPNNNRRCSC